MFWNIFNKVINGAAFVHVNVVKIPGVKPDKKGEDAAWNKITKNDPNFKWGTDEGLASLQKALADMVEDRKVRK